jgi:hypothetical protein
MDVFLSWSGTHSHEIALFLRDWLQEVLPGCKPWVSSEDIAKGTRWSDALHTQLDKTQICLVCVTPENVLSPWLYYEAGYIANKLGVTAVCPYLVGVPAKLVTGTPLGLYQCTQADKADTLKLIRDLNRLLAEPHDTRLLEGNFQAKWPQLKRRIEKVLEGLTEVEDPVARVEPPLAQRLTQEAQELLIAACDNGGDIMYIRYLGGTQFQTGQRQFVTGTDPRSLALWKGALDELIGFGLVEPVGIRGEIFRVTREGWSVSDALKPSAAPAAT